MTSDSFPAMLYPTSSKNVDSVCILGKGHEVIQTKKPGDCMVQEPCTMNHIAVCYCSNMYGEASTTSMRLLTNTCGELPQPSGSPEPVGASRFKGLLPQNLL